MSDFPVLGSGAKSQYPLKQSVRFQTHVIRFVDGGEQRFRQHRGAQKEWSMGLSALSAGEAAAFCEFAESQAGQQGEFAFADPYSGDVVNGCSLGQDTLQTTQTDEDKHTLQVTVKSKV